MKQEEGEKERERKDERKKGDRGQPFRFQTTPTRPSFIPLVTLRCDGRRETRGMRKEEKRVRSRRYN